MTSIEKRLDRQEQELRELRKEIHAIELALGIQPPSKKQKRSIIAAIGNNDT